MGNLEDNEALNEDGEAVFQITGDIFCDGLVVVAGIKTSFEMRMVFFLAAFAVSLEVALYLQQSFG